MRSEKLDKYVLLILGGILVIGVVGLIVFNVYKTLSQELDFKEREIHGTVLGLDSIGRGKYVITIRQSTTQDTVMYSLFMNQIMKEFKIGPGDSVSKSSDSFSATFYKKRNNEYYKCCEY